MHNCLPTKVLIYKQTPEKGKLTDKCKYCKKAETTLHLFARCVIATKIWKTYKQTYMLLTGQATFFYEQTVLTLNILGADITDKQRKLTLTFINVVLQEIWNSRNRFEKENLLPNIERSVKSINTKIKYILTTHFKHYVKQKDIQEFIKRFATNSALCQVIKGTLCFKLPKYCP